MVKSAFITYLSLLTPLLGNKLNKQVDSSALLSRVSSTMKLAILFLALFGILEISADGSWDSYIDNLIAQSRDEYGNANCDKACIISLDGGAKWTTDGHANAFKLSVGEATRIASAFKTKDFTTFMTSGIVCEGVKYQFLREEEGKIVYGKKKGAGAVTLQASTTAIVIGHVSEGGQQGNLNKGVGAIAEYLESSGM